MEKFITEAQLFFRKEAAYHLNLIWDACNLVTFNETTKFLIVHTEKVVTTTLQDNQQFFRYAVFTFLKEKIIYGRIIEVIGDSDFVEKNTESIMQLRHQRTIEGFTGKIIEYDLNYSYKFAGLVYKEGALTEDSIMFSLGNNALLKERPKARIISTTTPGQGIYAVIFYANEIETWELIYDKSVHRETQEPPIGGIRLISIAGNTGIKGWHAPQ